MEAAQVVIVIGVCLKIFTMVGRLQQKITYLLQTASENAVDIPFMRGKSRPVSLLNPPHTPTGYAAATLRLEASAPCARHPTHDRLLR